MDSLIEKYLRETGIEMRTWVKNGLSVHASEQERIVHSLLASYVCRQLERKDLKFKENNKFKQCEFG